MIEYSVVLKRHKNVSRPNVIVFRDESRDEALKQMLAYRKKNGFTVQENGHTFSIADILLVEQDSIYGSPVISTKRYHELFDIYDRPIEEA